MENSRFPVLSVPLFLLCPADPGGSVSSHVGRSDSGKELDPDPAGRRGEAPGHHDGGGAPQSFGGYQED